MELKLFIRQNPIFNPNISATQQIYYDGANPQSLSPYVGGLPIGSPRRWPNYGQFVDVTDFVSDIFKLRLSWSTNRDSNGQIAQGGFQTIKGVGGGLTIEKDAYYLLKKWLIEDVSATLNSVEVKILDTSCGYYTGYVIKSSDLTWCESGLCVFDVNIKQIDPLITCVKRTLITDNWQGWFPDNGVPLNGKKHPRFSYCNEQSPNGTFIMMWYLMTSIIGTIALFIIPILGVVNSIIFIINTIINTINAIISIVGGTPLNLVNFFTISTVFDGLSTIYIESSGCGREHPAPLIRDYITNVCDKCGVLVTAQTAPIFFSSTIDIETSNRGILINQPNPHYNACYLNAPVSRGLRRFRRMSFAGGFQDPNNEYWIQPNAPIHYLDTFLDEVKVLYNAEWRIQNGMLYIARKDFFVNAAPLYDFSEFGADRSKIIEGICYEPNGERYPVSCNGIYAPDGSDTCGNEAGNVNGTGQMNGVTDFGQTDTNPNFLGVLEKVSQFGATHFRLDGVSNDYIYDAFQVIMNGGGFSASQIPGITFTILQQVSERLALYADYALLLSGENCVLPKVLLWDGESFENAKAIRPKAAWPGVAAQPLPDINPLYNTAPSPWNVRHSPQTLVLGRALTLAAIPSGVYRVTDFLGVILTERPALLPNYPMYFEPYYLDTLWDWFHWIDDPRRNPKMNMNWRLKIRYCCEDVKKLKLLNGAESNALLQKILVSTGYYKNGVLREIEVNFDGADTYGKWIELRGSC